MNLTVNLAAVLTVLILILFALFALGVLAAVFRRLRQAARLRGRSEELRRRSARVRRVVERRAHLADIDPRARTALQSAQAALDEADHAIRDAIELRDLDVAEDAIDDADHEAHLAAGYVSRTADLQDAFRTFTGRPLPETLGEDPDS